MGIIHKYMEDSRCKVSSPNCTLYSTCQHSIGTVESRVHAVGHWSSRETQPFQYCNHVSVCSVQYSLACHAAPTLSIMAINAEGRGWLRRLCAMCDQDNRQTAVIHTWTRRHISGLTFEWICRMATCFVRHMNALLLYMCTLYWHSSCGANLFGGCKLSVWEGEFNSVVCIAGQPVSQIWGSKFQSRQVTLAAMSK